MNTPKMACCCVRDMEEMNSPTPVMERIKTNMDMYNMIRLPTMGEPKRNTAAARSTEPSNIPIINAGKAFAVMISVGVRGDTSSCSNVPISFSLATDSAVITMVMSVVMIPTRQGRVNQR